MKILIYGFGAVGAGIGSCLLKAGQTIDIIARSTTVKNLKTDGLSRNGIFGEFHAPPESFQTFLTLSDIPQKTYDFILVCTKSFDSLSVAKDIAQNSFIFNKKTKIILFQNGWGNAEVFSDFFPPSSIFNARVITGFYRPQPHQVTITVHADDIHIGSLFTSDLLKLETLVDLITQGGIPTLTVQDIEKDLWAKMLYNCALNPLGALFHVTYGTLGENLHTKTIMKKIVEEIFTVMQSNDYQTFWQHPQEYLNVFYQKLLPPTATHKSSTLQDIQNKKQTEIDALNGAIIKLATYKEIDVPYNQMIYDMIKFIESS